MKRIDIIYKTLKEWSEGKEKWVSAQQLADALQLDRANVSGDLNKLWREGKVKKKPGRPVLFTVADQDTKPMFATKLDEIANYQPSLAMAVEQGKAAILYPPKGMHILILGETGTGKSMFAKLLHEFARDVKKISRNAPFITFNCADYANNPQLLLGQLFGVKKGAYTGATEQKGLIEKADNGILFLDEVHRLPAEGQEMLFTFIDQGIYRRLGETETERSANVLLICATTEDPESSLLTTFRRRIPMNIYLPPLRERTVEERQYLIFQFFCEEAVRLRKDIHVSANSIRALLFYPCPNNVGQLKADIQLLCAKAYADFVTMKKEKIQINSSDLPDHIKEGLFLEKKRITTISLEHRYYIFSPDKEREQFFQDEGEYGTLYENIERKFNELKARGISDDELELLMEIDIENYFSQYIKGVNRRIHKGGNLEKIIDANIMQLTKLIISYVEKKLGRNFTNKVIYSLALHIQTSLNRIKSGKAIIHPQLNKIRAMYKKEFYVALDCLKMIEEYANVDFPIDEAGFLTMFFVLSQDEVSDEEECVSIFVMMHGTGAAAAIADVVNQLLSTDHVKSLDMPLDADPKQIYDQVKMMVKESASKKGIILLVDMGSFVTFAELLEKDVGIPVRVITAASTPHVLEATRKAIVGYSLDEIYEGVKNTVPFYTNHLLSNKTSLQHDKLAIVTACITGKGSATALKRILETYLRFDESKWEIIPINIDSRTNMINTLTKLETTYRIICIVSSVSVPVHIPNFHIEDVLSLRAIKLIQSMIDIEETYMQMEETLKSYLQHIEAKECVRNVRTCLNSIQKQLNIDIQPYDIMGLVLHICCMIDRLISGEQSVYYDQKEEYIKDHIHLFTIIKNRMQELEKIYNIHISDDELCYVTEFFDYYKQKQ
jgi:transcriptional regulatory protein LevR/transcriptional regulator with AAA-type ATPase domain